LQRIRVRTENIMHFQQMTQNENYRRLVMHLSTALAITEAAHLKAKSRRNL
jgi:hypothetical protein